jgi:hypothetical protein
MVAAPTNITCVTRMRFWGSRVVFILYFCALLLAADLAADIDPL